MNLNEFVEPRYDIWMKIANIIEERYLSNNNNIDWNALKQNIPSVSQNKIFLQLAKTESIKF
ncbi:hypothetical protein [Mastigocoleus sp. MO_188.B34]|uniref:hypothetical protein n=1 Tax=Mastigocoleus sp. MO_188.B34 TaxID=3036635 RepID=UPI00261AC75A|nr:hypothetical protein [Mastigocoleus sp. MO_188.B34]